MNSAHYIIQASGLARKFNAVFLFRDIEVTVETGESFSVTGPNGSGKSTLLKILAGIQAPTAGTISHSAGAEIPRSEWPVHIGYTGPLVNPYDELSAPENIRFALGRGRGMSAAEALLDRFDLSRHGEKKLKHYSSGMKQRLRIILALVNDPPVLILDEPGTNLDGPGREILYAHIESVRKEKIIILATNDAREEKLCGRGIRLGR
jgi:heme exporter protein A